MRAFCSSHLLLALVLGVCTGLLAPSTSRAQRADANTAPSDVGANPTEAQQPLVLTRNAAVRIALEQNLDLQDAQLTLEEANARVRESWGEIYPQVDFTGGYTRNIVTANPFAGGDVGAFLGGDNETDWVAFNERQRLSGGQPIPFQTFVQRQRDSLQAAGVSLASGGNPFTVANEFRSSIQITQTLYNGQAFGSIQGSQQFKDLNQFARDRQVQVTANEVVTAFYDALMAQERARILQKRVDRASRNMQEVSMRVERGTVPKSARLGAEVELSNARSSMIEARNAAGLSRDNLKQTIGISPERPVELKGSLDEEQRDGMQEVSLETVSMSNAVTQAIENRPDLRRAQLNVDLREIQTSNAQAQFLPRVEGIITFDYTGRVPSNRTRVQTTDPQDPTNPFFFREQDRGFFENEFWNPSLSGGVQLTWNLFSGFQKSARVQQAEVERRRAEVQQERLRRAVKVEVRKAIRDLEDARERIEAQETNVRRAEMNYDHVSKRVGEGAANQVELREASDQLDQSRLNYLRAVRDYLVARSNLETALGQPLTPTSESYLMTRR
jgi:outer membrane protein TolC